MNNLKYALIALGVLGAVAIFLPTVSAGSDSMSFWKLASIPEAGIGKTFAIVLIAGFGVAAAMGVIGVVKPPIQRWQAILALVGFALVLFKLRNGIGTGFVNMLEHGAIGAKIMLIAPILGILVSVGMLAKPETAR